MDLDGRRDEAESPYELIALFLHFLASLMLLWHGNLVLSGGYPTCRHTVEL